MKDEIILYAPNGLTEHIEVRIDEETVWLSQQQMATLFNQTKQNISLHINNCFREKELEKEATIKESLTVQKEGNRNVQRKIEYYTQGVFFDGQVFDAYELVSKIIRSAKQNIVLIDNYIDENTLTHLAKKKKTVAVLLLTKTNSKQQVLDIKKANEQYGNFEAKIFTQSHDRFLIIDETEVYHLGASLKDLGKKWFAFSKMDKNSVNNILNSISELI